MYRKLILTVLAGFFTFFNGFCQYNSETVQKLRAGLASAPDSSIGKIYTKLFTEFYSHSAFDSAKAVAVEGIKKARQLKDRKFESTAMIWKGMVDFEKGNYEDALAVYIEADKIKEAINDQRGEASLLLNMAGIYYEQSNPEKAIDIYLRALKIKIQLNDKVGQANIYINLGNVAESQSKLNEAEKFYKRGEVLAHEVKDSIVEAISDRCMANIYLRQNRIAEAENLAYTAYKYLRLKRDRNYTQTLILLGKVHFRIGNYYKSKDYLEEAYQISIDNATPFLTADACKELAQTYLKLKDYDRSFAFQKKGSDISDSLQGVKLGEQLADMQIKYETAKKTKIH